MYKGQKLKILSMLVALSAASTLANVASAQSNSGFSYPSGFASAGNAVNIVGHAALNGSEIDLTTTAGIHEAGAAWYTTPQNIQTFTTDFTFRQDPSAYGMFFVVQNSNGSTNQPGYYGSSAVADANGEGFGDYRGQDAAIGNSVGLKFDLTNFDGNAQALPSHISTTGIFVDGGPIEANFAPATDLMSLGIDLHSNHIMSAHVVYDGTLLTMVLTDTVTRVQARLSWPINIPAVVGSNTAYVGFCAGRIPSVVSAVLSWSFSPGYSPRLAAPTFSVPSGAYQAGQSVSLSASPGAAIYYTTNGNPPTTASNLYTGPIVINSNEVVQAIAVQSGNTDSLVATANYQIGAAGGPIINIASGFGGASNLLNLNGNAQITGSTLSLTVPGYEEVGSAWFAAPVNIQTFNTTFTMQITNAQANGMAFVIQNQYSATSRGANSGGPFALGSAAAELGYGGTDIGGGLRNSLAVIFDVYNGSGNLTGLYTNGASPTGSSIDMSSSGVNLRSGDPFAVSLNYDGTTLSMTITDTKTRATFSKSWTINIPATVGGNSTAWVGFTGATGGLSANNNVLSWTYSSTTATASVPVPSPPTNLRVK